MGRNQRGGGADQHVDALVGAQGRDGADHRALGRDPELGADVGARPRRRDRRSRSGSARSSRPGSARSRSSAGGPRSRRRRSPSPPRAISCRSSSCRSGRPSNAQLCSCAMNAGTRASGVEQRAPDVGAELVRVQDVDRVAAQAHHQPAPWPQGRATVALEPDELDARRRRARPAPAARSGPRRSPGPSG